MKKAIVQLLIFTLFFYSCTAYDLKEPHKNNYTTSGALSDDCFQVIITVQPERDLKTMADQRENAFIKAKGNIPPETEKQILSFYTTNKSITIDELPQERLDLLKKKSEKYSVSGTIEQEYYLSDNSAVLVYRIFKKGIKNEILNN